MERAKAFYESTFLISLERLDSSSIELWAFPFRPDAPGCGGALANMDGKDAGVGGTIVYLSCADCAVEATRAIQGGGRIHKPKSPIGPHGFIALVYDTEGNLIGLHSMS